MLAESVRALERDGHAPVADDAEATRAGREVAGDVEAKIVARASATGTAPDLRRSLHRFQASAIWMAAAFVLIVAFIGAGAARAALGVDEHARVNFFLALGTLLGVQTVVLLLWLLLILARPSAMGSASFGGFVRWMVDLIMRRASRSPTQVAALEGAATVHGRPRLAKWTLSTVSHAGWLAFNVGCLAALIALLSARHYTFVWETTILSERAYAPMVETIGSVPSQLGFSVPTEAQVHESQWRGTELDPVAAEGESREARATRRAWAGLLVGSIVVYGAGPRILLLVLCIWRMRTARRAYRLDLGRTGFALLASRLSPRQQSLGVIDPDTGDGRGEVASVGESTRAGRPIGPPAIVGIEMEPPCHWPPRPDGVTLHDLGILNDRPDRQRVIHELHTAAQEPEALVIACPLPATPDRGVRSIIAQLRAAVSRPAIVLLTGGQSLRERADAAALGRRVEDWRALAVEAGVQPEHVIELDLDHATHASLSRLASMLQSTAEHERARSATANQGTSRGIERAFALIVEHTHKWQGPPNHREQTILHREILGVYGSEPSQWSSLLSLRNSISEASVDAATSLRTNADRALQLLPAHLRIRPKWAIAGASAGAIGCIAAAMIAAPAAIGALPIWTVVGSAIAAAVSTVLPPMDAGDESASGGTSETGDAVRAAALSTLILELQGRSEQSISRILDRTLSPPEVDGHAALASQDEVRDWLATLRHRFDIALAEEARS